MNWLFFIKEVLRGKTIGRALISVNLSELFKQETWLDDNFSVLELGSEPASHQRLLPPQWKIVASNYKTMPNIDLVIDLEKPFPLTTGQFDGIICFNVLYIIDNYLNFFREALRVSKGFVLFQIPLIQCIVPHPHDYTRMTRDRIIKIMSELGEPAGARYSIIPLGGSFSSAVSLIDPYLKFRVAKLLFYLPALCLDRLDRFFKRECPLMYLVLIKKYG